MTEEQLSMIEDCKRKGIELIPEDRGFIERIKYLDRLTRGQFVRLCKIWESLELNN